MLGAKQLIAATHIPSGYQIEMIATTLPYTRTNVSILEFDSLQSTMWFEKAYEIR